MKVRLISSFEVEWGQQAKLNAADGSPGDYFGYSVSISGDYALVGVYADGFSDQGSAYIFFRSGVSWGD